MPASITHELVACEAADLLPKNARELVFAAPDYYYLGAQGPDLFFFYKPLSSEESNLGSFLHRTRIKAWFSALLCSLEGFTGTQFERSLSYALGFCTHLSADAVFHPFIYRFLRNMDCPRLTHQEIENDWDVYFLDKLRGKRADRHLSPFDLGQIAADGVLYRYLSQAASKIGRELSPVPFRRMCRHFSLYLRHIHSSHPKVLRLFGAGKLYPRSSPDPAYLRGKNFLSFSGGRASDADGLFALAAEQSADRISAFLEAFNTDMVLPDELFSVHMLTGDRTSR